MRIPQHRRLRRRSLMSARCLQRPPAPPQHASRDLAPAAHGLGRHRWHRWHALPSNARASPRGHRPAPALMAPRAPVSHHRPWRARRRFRGAARSAVGGGRAGLGAVHRRAAPLVPKCHVYVSLPHRRDWAIPLRTGLRLQRRRGCERARDGQDGRPATTSSAPRAWPRGAVHRRATGAPMAVLLC